MALIEEITTKEFPLRDFGLTYSLKSDGGGKEKKNGQVGYAVYGFLSTSDGKFDSEWEQKKDTSTICLFFHGLPGGRLFFSKSMAKVSEERKVTVLAIKRPGYGVSSLVSKEVSWEEIVSEVLESLGLLEGERRKFMVVGYSGGGPYALSLGGGEFAKKYISSISVVGCTCPPIAGATRGFSWVEKLGYFFAQNSSWLLEKAIRHFDWEDFHKDPIGYFYHSYTLFSTSDTSTYLYDPDIELKGRLFFLLKRCFVTKKKE